MSDKQKNDLLIYLNNLHQAGHPEGSTEKLLRTRMELEATESQMRAAVADEKAAVATERAADAAIKNARYMFWSVIAAAISAIASLRSSAIVVFERGKRR